MNAIARLAIAIVVAALATSVAAQEPMTKVKDLYDAASYGEALAALTLVEGSADLIDVEKYRALCLLALGQSEELSSRCRRWR